MKNEIILYRQDELSEHKEVRIDEKTETIWLTRQQIADLFGTKRSAITKHLKNIFMSGELEETMVSSILEHTLNTVPSKEKYRSPRSSITISTQCYLSDTESIPFAPPNSAFGLPEFSKIIF